MGKVAKPRTPRLKKNTNYHKHVSKPAHKSELSKSNRNSIVSPTKTPRGPILITRLPWVEEQEDDDPAQVPQDISEFKKRYTPYAKMK
ncbi:hypothetical protein FRC09_018795, partial [Ceratobasidium sp. 395]